MRNLKITFIPLFFSMLSSMVMAKEVDDAKIKAAAENTIAKIEATLALVKQGGRQEAIIISVNDAIRLQTEFRYQATKRQHEKASAKLRLARSSAEKGKMAVVRAKPNEALSDFKEMKAKFDGKKP